MQRRGRRRPIIRVLWAIVSAFIAVSVLALPAQSSQETIDEVGSLPLRVPKGFPADGGNASLIVNSALRRGYQFFFLDTELRMIGRVIDLDTQKILVDRTMPSEIFPAGPLPSTVGPGEWVHAVNPDTGDLYLAAQNFDLGGFEGIARLDPKTLDVKAFFTREVLTYEPHVDPANPLNQCLSSTCLPQAPTAAPELRGLTFSPSVLTGLNDKLLLLMQETKPPQLDSNFNVAYAAQWDAETGHQDWIYRIQACSGATFPGRGDGMFQLGIFQARLGTGIYISCQAGGGLGQVVRLPVDSLNTPIQNAEQAFPGPQRAVDGIADPDSDRMILRVANEEGDSWWVFDGGSSSYAGVIGGTLSRVTAIASGIDEATGRLYMFAPPSDNGAQSSEGGLLISDIRRSPAPQFLSFEQYAARWVGIVRVDTNPTTGERLVYAREENADRYRIFRDAVPISGDTLIQDQDRLTIDREEKATVTGRNFTGSGHAYGARVVMAGGLEGFPPTGPDVQIRIGRYVPMMLGSPCGPGDREIAIGTVDQASLSNDLSSAGASVGNADPGTKTDLGEPTARCYPRPRDPDGSDVWTKQQPVTGTRIQDVAGDYPRPNRAELDDEETGSKNEPKTDADELAGTAWPFSPTQCSGDDDASTTTELQPFDRGDTETGPIPQEQRDQVIPFDDFRAEVHCAQEKARVDASSQILLAKGEAPALEVDVPDLGKIRVAEVSSSATIYLHPERGLVSRTVSAARGISIGDHVFIDGVYTFAEAWAAGRSGTAGTDFQRFICGVRIKDEAPDQTVYRPNPRVVTPPADDPTSWDPTTAVDPNLEGGGEVDKGPGKSACGDPDESALGAIRGPTGIDDSQPLIDIINRALAGRGRVSAPKPDGQLSQGTPGGYLASIQKDRLNEISSRAVNNDPSTQVPGLELIVFNDDPIQGRGRQLYQFAGVDASVTYGIYLLNPDEFFDPGCEPFCIEQKIDDFVPDPATPYVPPIVPDQPPAKQGPITMLFSGVNFLLRAPLEALLAAAVWAILFAPVQLASRRRALRGLR
jgi:hypothetical protein